MRRPTRLSVPGREHGFSLIEQIVAVALIGTVAVPMLLVISGLVRGASRSDAQITILNLAKSQVESVKQQPYQPFGGSYSVVPEVPEGYVVSVAASPVRTYFYPEPDPTSTLPDEVQLVTVEVSCSDCAPTVASFTLSVYKIRR